MELLNKYDKFLFIDKKLNGLIELKRKSQFYKTINYDVFTITNQYLGSYRWVISKLRKMDSRKIDLISRGIREGYERRKGKTTDDRMSREVATFIQEGTKIVI